MLFNCGVEKTLGIPQTVRRSNQHILREICPEYSLEGLMLKQKLQYFVLLMRRTDSLEKILMLGKIEGMTEYDVFEWYHRLNGHVFQQATGDSDGQESLVCCSPWGHRVGHD